VNALILSTTAGSRTVGGSWACAFAVEDAKADAGQRNDSSVSGSAAASIVRTPSLVLEEEINERHA
jgi:hypothetical protein